MEFQKIQTFGNIPLPRFGHTTTLLGKNRVILYGGATGNTGQFSITDNTYILDLNNKNWKKLEAAGLAPSPRAAHASVAISNNQMMVYGGATGSGGLASQQLFLLELKQTGAVWKIIETVGRGPGKRYGHSLCFNNPFLIVFGGNTGDKSVADCWVLNIEKHPIGWQQVKSNNPQKSPSARVYHSAALCPSGTAQGMIVVFGGRGGDQQALNDSWGLRRHRDGRWDWVKAPYRDQPSGRYQHSVLFIGSLMVVIGGRTNNVAENLQMQVYDIESSDWFKFNGPQRFRNGTWLVDVHLYAYGGFQITTPNTPTDTLIRINLMSVFNKNQFLKQKISKFEAPPDVKPVTPKMGGKTSTQSAIILNTAQSAKNTITQQKTLKDPKLSYMDPRKNNLTIKQDLPLMFLNQLCQPELYQNIEAIRFNFKPSQIISLIEMVKEIVIQQPILLKVKAPLKIFGDIHGQLSDLLSFFRLYGAPYDKGQKGDIQNFDYIFLGDFIDRGNHSLQTMCLLLSLKALCPKTIHLIRGNHQDHQINCTFGFIDECIEKCKQDPADPNSVFNHMNKLFEWLPLAAVVQDKILCLHGGIGSSVKTLDDISKIKRPIEISHQVNTMQQQVILDILWSDPTESDAQMGILPNFMRDPHETGNIIKFGPDIVQNFLKNTGLSMIIRGHQCVMDGFQRFAGGSLITVFSATDYCRRHKNAGAILILKTNLQIIPKLIYPWNGNGNNWMDDEQDLKKRPPTPPRWRRTKG